MEIGRAHIDLTGKCNQRCKHCHMSQYYEEELSTEKILSLVNKLNKLGMKKIAFAGGEPFLRKDLFEIMKICPRNISILTNATLLDDLLIKKISDFEKKYDKIITLRISVDGLESHKKLRGYDSKKVIRIIKKLKETGFIVVINTVICPFIKENELIEMFYLFEDMGIDQWNVDLPFEEGSFKENKLKVDMTFVMKELKKLVTVYFKRDRNIRLDIISLFCSERIKRDLGFYECDFDESPCDYQFHSITINPKGEILLCPSLHVPFGKIENLEEYRKSEKWKKFTSKKINYPEGCNNCKYLKICGGGCRANALTATGNIWGKDEVSCALMEFLENEILPLYPDKLQKEFKNLLLEQKPKNEINILEYSSKKHDKLILSLFKQIYPGWTKEERGKMCYDEKKSGHISTKLGFANEAIVGQSNIFRIGNFKNIANLGYHIHPNHRRRGHALSLCKEAIETAKQNGVNLLIIRTEKTNFAAIKLAKKLGFTLMNESLTAGDNDLSFLKNDNLLIFSMNLNL